MGPPMPLRFRESIVRRCEPFRNDDRPRRVHPPRRPPPPRAPRPRGVPRRPRGLRPRAEVGGARARQPLLIPPEGARALGRRGPVPEDRGGAGPEVPEIQAALGDGRLCLSSAIELAKVITPENAADVLPRFFGLSSRDAAFVAASIRPVENAPRRDFLVRPVRAVATVSTTSDRPAAPAGPPGSLGLRAPETPAADGAKAAPSGASPLPRPTAPALDRPAVKPLDAERARVSMTVSRRLLDKLAAARDALSHSHPGASEEEILEVGLDLILQRHAKRRGLVERPRQRAQERAPASAAPRSESTSSPPPPLKRSRHVPAEIWRGVWKRDRGLLLVSARGRRSLRLHVSGGARSHRRLRARRGHHGRRVPASLPRPPGRRRPPALRGRPHESLHAAEGWALLGAGRGLRRRRHLARARINRPRVSCPRLRARQPAEVGPSSLSIRTASQDSPLRRRKPPGASPRGSNPCLR